MKKVLNKKMALRKRRHNRIRMSGVYGTAEKPRLSYFKSNTNIYAQMIDDDKKETLIGMSSLKSTKKGIERAKEMGEAMAAKAKEKGIKQVVFDRGGFMYTGNIKTFADTVRKGGIKF